MPKRYGKGLRPAPIAAERSCNCAESCGAMKKNACGKNCAIQQSAFTTQRLCQTRTFAQMMAFIEKWGSDAAQTETVVCAVLDIPCNCPCSELVCARKTGFGKFRVRDD